MKNIQKELLAAVLAVSGLALLGAGCLRTAGEGLGDSVGQAVGTPLDAYRQAADLSEEEQARRNREAEESSNYVTVAVILTEGSEIPDGAEPGPKVGCNDQVAFVRASRLTDSGQVVIDALNTVLGADDVAFGGLYNSLAQTGLRVADGAYITGDLGVEIRLEGEVRSAGACDDPRIRAQVEETVRRFHPHFTVFLNGSESAWRCFGDMSGLCL